MSRVSPRRLAISCVASVALLAVVELLLRSGSDGRWGPKAPIVWDIGDGPTGQAMNEISRALWTPRPGAIDPWGDTIGEAGCRGPALASGSGRLRLLALGDSSTYGYGVREAEAWPRLLEAELRTRGLQVDVLNGGTIGYTVVQGRVRFAELAPLAEPVLVVLAFGAFNEHLAAPGGIDDRTRVDLWDRRDRWSDRLRRESAVVQFFAELAGGGLRTPDPALQQRRDLWGEPDYSGMRRVSLDQFTAELTGLCGDVRAAGAEPLLVAMPRRQDLEARKAVMEHYSQAVHGVAAASSVALVDVRTDFRSQSAEEVFLPKDWVHPSSAGHARIASLLAPTVAQLLRSR